MRPASTAACAIGSRPYILIDCHADSMAAFCMVRTIYARNSFSLTTPRGYFDSPASGPFEREERRRTFWMAFYEDRYASIGTGWAMTIDEKDILTNLPVSDEAFELSRPEENQSLEEA